MIIWKDKKGNKLTPKEFWLRFKQGMAEATPLQQTRMQILFTWIMVTGLVLGIVVSAFGWRKLWWVIVILVAALGNTSIGLIALYQKYKALKNVYDMINGETLGDIKDSLEIQERLGAKLIKISEDI